MHAPALFAPARQANRDFWLFWGGETISNLGSSFTQFVLPLLVFKLTGSALNLGITTAATFLPYLLFGLVIGAWVDRLDRKRLIVVCLNSLRSLRITFRRFEPPEALALPYFFSTSVQNRFPAFRLG